MINAEIAVALFLRLAAFRLRHAERSISRLPFLSEQAQRNILGLNAAKLFNLEVPGR